MKTAAEDRFFRRLRTALGHAPDLSRDATQLFAQGPSADELQMLDRIDGRSAADRRRLLERLIEAGTPINLRVVPVFDPAAAREGIAAVVAEKRPEWGEAKSVAAWRHPLIDRLGLEGALARRQVPLRITDPIAPGAGAGRECDRAQRDRQRAAVIASFIGVTGADFCLAETATLVLRNRPGQPRSVALVPSIHIAVITLDQVLADMKELFALLRWAERFRPEGLSNYMSLISGPSKTADIEATMVHGAHGPREVHLFVITG
ncbi:MAG: lactate utilization protein [Desulfobacterales bacterium]|jgi:L-lactate dehydrogenase complex protein LldG|nr:lactate utilization protein [Desulfobacterales bacterium]